MGMELRPIGNSPSASLDLYVGATKVATFKEDGSADLPYKNTTSGLTATTVDTAIDELSSANNVGTKKALNATGNAPIYACRAWASFDGETQQVFGSGNVSSITKNSGGDYTMNFLTNMTGTNYGWAGNSYSNGSADASSVVSGYVKQANSLRVVLSRNSTTNTGQTTQGANEVSLSVFGQ